MIEPNYIMKGLVTRVVDGDTVVMNVSPAFKIFLNEYKFRLWGINTCETNDKDEIKRGLAQLAKQYVKDAIEGKEVMVKTIKNNKSSETIDSFGRYLAIIYYDKAGVQTELNQELVNLGMAVEYMR